MILLTMLLIVLIGIILTVTIGLAIFGTAGIIVFGDLMVFLIVMGLLIRHFIRKRRS